MASADTSPSASTAREAPGTRCRRASSSKRGCQPARSIARATPGSLRRMTAWDGSIPRFNTAGGVVVEVPGILRAVGREPTSRLADHRPGDAHDDDQARRELLGTERGALPPPPSGGHAAGSGLAQEPLGVDSLIIPGRNAGLRRSVSLAVSDVVRDDIEQARASGIMRFPAPHDRDGHRCLPSYHPRFQPPSPSSPTPTPSRRPKRRTCWPTWPRSATREVAVAAATRWSRSWPWPPRRCWAAHDRWPRSPSRPQMPRSWSGWRLAPAVMARPLGRALRGHYPSHAGPPGRRDPGRGDRRVTGRPRPPRPAASMGGRGGRQDPSGRQA